MSNATLGGDVVNSSLTLTNDAFHNRRQQPPAMPTTSYQLMKRLQVTSPRAAEEQIYAMYDREEETPQANRRALAEAFPLVAEPAPIPPHVEEDVDLIPSPSPSPPSTPPALTMQQLIAIFRTGLEAVESLTDCTDLDDSTTLMTWYRLCAYAFELLQSVGVDREAAFKVMSIRHLVSHHNSMHDAVRILKPRAETTCDEVCENPAPSPMSLSLLQMLVDMKLEDDALKAAYHKQIVDLEELRELFDLHLQSDHDHETSNACSSVKAQYDMHAATEEKSCPPDRPLRVDGDSFLDFDDDDGKENEIEAEMF